MNRRSIGNLYTTGFCILFVLFFVACYIAFYACGKEELAWEDQDEVLRVSVEGNLVSKNAAYYVRYKNLSTGETTIEQETLPVGFIGLTREQLVALLYTNKASMIKTTEDKRLQDIVLIRFSPDVICVEKTYLDAKSEGSFLVSIYDNHLIVFWADAKSIFMETDILADQIPVQYRNEFLQGKTIGSEEELFDLLESFSS